MSDFNGKKRSELPDEVFGIPQERKYPMPDEKHTRSAIKLFNHVDPKYEEQLAKAVIKNMKKYNIDGSVVGPNNRLRKYLPKDMIKEYVEEACKDLIHARKLCNAVRKLARKYNANYFFVTDGASSYSNGNGKYNPAAKEMRDHMDDWERNNGFNPDDDWTNDINNVSNYRLLKESSILEGLLKSDFSYTGIKTSTEKSEFKRDFREVFKEDPTESSINYMQMIKYKGSLVGYIGFSRYKEGKKKYLGIGNFMIIKRYQHNAALDCVISDIIDRYKDNYDEIYCYVDKDNTSAIAFYKKIAKVNTDNLTKYGYYVTLYSKSIGESSMNEQKDDSVLPILELQRRLSKFKYGVPINGKIKNASEIDFGKEYKTLTSKEFEKYEAGVCWDFANYQEIELAKMYGKSSIQNYYFIVDKEPNYPTHTITVIKIGSYFYYPEASWG